MKNVWRSQASISINSCTGLSSLSLWVSLRWILWKEGIHLRTPLCWRCRPPHDGDEEWGIETRNPPQSHQCWEREWFRRFTSRWTMQYSLEVGKTGLHRCVSCRISMFYILEIEVPAKGGHAWTSPHEGRATWKVLQQACSPGRVRPGHDHGL